MSDVRRVPSGNTPEQVLAGEVASLRQQLDDLRSTVLARTSPRDSFVLLDSSGAAWVVTVTTTGDLETSPA